MRALYLDRGRLSLRQDLPRPSPAAGEVRVRVLRAGICATDLALARGYMAFAGVPGHEFVGVALEGDLAGQRVVGEINAGCGACALCAAGDPRHCQDRSVLGIVRRAGAFADELSLPRCNLLPVPAAVSTDAATFTEPLAAALQIGSQVDLTRCARALVIGDGKLGLLCAHALLLAGVAVTLSGRHRERAALVPGAHHVVGWLDDDAPARATFPLVVDASGNSQTLARALAYVEPRGSLVLKTTTEQPSSLDAAAIVVHELTVLGSRCGPFAPALAALAGGRVPVESLIAARYPLAEGERAFAHAGRRGVLKVLLDLEAESAAASG